MLNGNDGTIAGHSLRRPRRPPVVLKVVGGTLADHTYLFLGAGEVSQSSAMSAAYSNTPFSSILRITVVFPCWHFVWLIPWISVVISSTQLLQAGTGIADLIALEMSKHVNNHSPCFGFAFAFY